MASAAKKKILVIEDDMFMVELLAQELAHAGFDTTVANTVEEGIEKFKANRPDLVLLDLILPGKGGFEFLRAVRRMPEGAAAKVVIFSNVAEGADIEEGKRLGVVDYLVKANYTLPEIVQKIQKIFA